MMNSSFQVLIKKHDFQWHQVGSDMIILLIFYYILSDYRIWYNFITGVIQYISSDYAFSFKKKKDKETKYS